MCYSSKIDYSIWQMEKNNSSSSSASAVPAAAATPATP
jgi:hypothetical protein